MLFYLNVSCKSSLTARRGILQSDFLLDGDAPGRLQTGGIEDGHRQLAGAIALPAILTAVIFDARFDCGRFPDIDHEILVVPVTEDYIDARTVLQSPRIVVWAFKLMLADCYAHAAIFLSGVALSFGFLGFRLLVAQ